MTTSQTLIEEYKLLSREDKYNKLIVYLHAAQKSAEELLGLYRLVESLGVDDIDEESMIELYDAFVSLVEYDDASKVAQAQKTLSTLQSLKQQEEQEHQQDEQDADNLLDTL